MHKCLTRVFQVGVPAKFIQKAARGTLICRDLQPKARLEREAQPMRELYHTLFDCVHLSLMVEDISRMGESLLPPFTGCGGEAGGA